jgi:hypothetical protein
MSCYTNCKVVEGYLIDKGEKELDDGSLVHVLDELASNMGLSLFVGCNQSGDWETLGLVIVIGKELGVGGDYADYCFEIEAKNSVPETTTIQGKTYSRSLYLVTSIG